MLPCPNIALLFLQILKGTINNRKCKHTSLSLTFSSTSNTAAEDDKSVFVHRALGFTLLVPVCLKYLSRGLQPEGENWKSVTIELTEMITDYIHLMQLEILIKLAFMRFLCTF